jgi:hypothetical protein
MTETREVGQILVQTAPDLAASDAGWTSQEWLTCKEFSYGAGQVVGYALLEQLYGSVKRAGRLNAETIGPAPNLDWATSGTLSGKHVRLCQEDPAGTIRLQVPYHTSLGVLAFETVTYTPIWWGVIRGPERSVSGATSPAGVATWRAAGLADLLDRCIIDTGYVLNADGSGPVAIAGCPPFNRKTIGSGDNSTGSTTINGATVSYHDLRTNSGVGVKWTAKRALDFVFAAAARRAVDNVGTTGLAWVIHDNNGALEYELPETDLNGRSVLEALNLLANTKRGISWFLSVSGAVPTINIVSGSAEAIAIGSFTLPANINTATLDVEDSEFLRDVRLIEDDSETSDIIIVQGDRPLSGINFYYQNGATGSLAKGWDSGDETAWNLNPEGSGLDPVWRRFVIEQTWDGGQYDHATEGLANTFSTTTDDAYGAGGLDGGRSYVSGTPTPSPYQIKGERCLPGAKDAGQNRFDDRDRPRIFTSVDGSTWIDQTEDFSISIESEPFAVVIDDGDNGATLKALLAISGYRFVVSVGVREVQPLKVSWIRDPVDWPCSTPRVKFIESRAALHQTIAYTATSESGGLLVSQSSTVEHRNELDAMRAQLALARASYGSRRYRVSWTDRMIAHSAVNGGAYQPGYLLTTITTGQESIPVNALIQRRTCRYVDNHWETTIEAETLRMSGEAVL